MPKDGRTSQVAQHRDRIQKLKASVDGSREVDRALCDEYRSVLRLCEDSVEQTLPTATNRSALNDLKELAKEAMLYLGGEADVWSTSLKDYDHQKYGPYLGVSDEGSAADVIRTAALASPKARALNAPTPMTVGVAHDAERLGAIGEVPVGPEEYTDIRLACTGRILTSTNVGTRLNLRFYKRNPVVVVPKGPGMEAEKRARRELRRTFKPFLDTPDGRPRPLTVFVEFHRESRRTFQDRAGILRRLSEYVRDSDFADPEVHRLGLQVRIGYGAGGRDGALLAVNVASASGLSDLAIDGVVSKEADALLSLPGLLNYLGPENLQPVLDRARQKGIRLRPVNAVDPDTVARNVWTSLLAARRQGVALGKYGTFPLTLEETDRVVAEVQRWFADWSAAPVCFVDHGILTAEKVYTRDSVVDGVKAWLNVVSKHGVPVVLIDTLDKSAGWKILKDASTGEKGLLSKSQIQSIDRFAAQRGIKALWAGGITLPQVYEFGKMSVFGIYVTSAAATAVPVSPAYESDPLLAALKEPTFEGVSRAKLLLEAGFLAEKQRDKHATTDLDIPAQRFIQELTKGKALEGQMHEQLEKELAEETLEAWKRQLQSS